MSGIVRELSGKCPGDVLWMFMFPVVQEISGKFRICPGFFPGMLGAVKGAPGIAEEVWAQHRDTETQKARDANRRSDSPSA